MSGTQEQDLVVFGAGLMRTGTMSLQAALQILLNGPCYHMTTNIEHPEHIAIWEKAANHGLTDDEWRNLFKGYKAAVDMPTAVFFERLSQVYPNAKVILSVRDPHGWYKSVNNTVKKLHDSLERFPLNIVKYLSPCRRFPIMVRAVDRYSNNNERNTDLGNEEEAVAYFERHVEKVKKTIPSERLLVFQAGEGWEPLCDFLGLPVPDQPYPHANSSGDFSGNVRRLVGYSIMKRIITSLLVGGAIGVTVYSAYERREILLEWSQGILNRS